MNVSCFLFYFDSPVFSVLSFASSLSRPIRFSCVSLLFIHVRRSRALCTRPLDPSGGRFRPVQIEDVNIRVWMMQISNILSDLEAEL